MTSSVTVSYGRKRTDKLGDGSFDAVELGAILTVSDIEEDTNPLAIQQSVYEALKAQVDKDFDSLPKNPLAVLKAIPAEQPRQITTEHAPAEPQRMDAPPAKPKEPLGWLKDKVDSETAVIQQRMQTLPGEHISGGSSVGTHVEAHDDYGTPPISSIRPNEAVMFTGCRVFESIVKPAVNGNEFCSIRIGKRGPDGIPGQYVTARSFDGKVVEAAKRIREGDNVDVYGFFKPWKNDPDKFDLELQKVEITQA